MLETILLETEQKGLLRLMVEAARSVPRDERKKFMAVKSNRGTDLLHPGLRGKDVRPFEGDLEALESEGLLRVSYGGRGTANYDITPLGYKYYEHLKSEIGEGPARLEEHVRSYLESAPFQSTFDKAFLKWAKAEGTLWQVGAEDHLTEIGHLCREALQEFVEKLAHTTKTDVLQIPKASTKRRVQAILESKRASLSLSTATVVDLPPKKWTPS